MLTGVQETLIVCMKTTGAQVIVTEENCDAAVKPTGRSVTCNTMACPPGLVVKMRISEF